MLLKKPWGQGSKRLSFFYYNKSSPPENSRIFSEEKKWCLVQMIHVLFKRVLLYPFVLGTKNLFIFGGVTLYFKPPGPQCCLRSHGWIVIGSCVFLLSEIYLKPTIPRKQALWWFPEKTPKPAGRSTPPPKKTWWWFQTFFIFTPIWGRFPIWLIFFKWVETTN